MKNEALEKLNDNIVKLKNRDKVIRSFVSPTIVTEVDLGLDPMEFTPREKTQAIMFIDMRDFTKFSESVETSESFDILNEYFNVINSIVFKYYGEVNKIIGDAILALFDDPDKCLEAAIEIRKAISHINNKRNKMSKTPIKFGMGISYGRVCQLILALRKIRSYCCRRCC